MNLLMRELPDFWLNFLLHTALLSIALWITCRLIRNPGCRSFTAMVGVFVIAVVPWFSAWKPIDLQQPGGKLKFVQPQQALPNWTIRIEQAEPAPTVPVGKMKAARRAERPDFRLLIAGVWLAGSVFAFSAFWMKQFRIHRLGKSSRAVSDSEWQRLFSHGIDRGEIRVADRRVGPCVAGFFKVRMILSRELLETAKDEELAWVIRHETCHLRSHDTRVATLLALVWATFWWNPALRSLCSIWADAREQCCDAAAVGEAAEGVEYGNFLIVLASRPVMGGGVWMARGNARRMRRRLLALKRQPGPMPKVGFKSLAIGAAAGLALLISCSKVSKEKSAIVAKSELPEISSVEEDFGEKIPVRAQVKVMIWMVATPNPLPESGRLLDPAAAEKLLQRITETRDSTVQMQPSMVVREGYIGTVDRTWEVPDEGITMHHLGRSSKLTFHRVGQDAEVDFTSCHTFDPTHYEFDSPTRPPEGYRLKKDPVMNTATLQRVLKNGQTAVISFDQKEQGKWINALVKIQAIDATGVATNSLLDFEDLGGPALGGKVRISGGILEMPAGVGFGTLGLPQYRTQGTQLHGTMEERLSEIREMVKLKGNLAGVHWTDLDEVVIDGPIEVAPWKHRPDIRILLRLCEGDRCYLRMRPYDTYGIIGQLHPFATERIRFDNEGSNLRVVFMKMEKL